MMCGLKLVSTVIVLTVLAGPTGAASAVTPINPGAIASGLLCNVIKPALPQAATGVSIGGRGAPRGDAFYAPPRPLPGCTHGDPVYVRRLDNPAAALVDGTNWLVMHRSEDVRGTPIATSGIIALPKSRPPRGGYPVISWAHGTVGVADACAPSRDQPGSTPI